MIQVQGLSKRFGRIQAVDGVSFSVEPGQVLGFLGPNGAGKSTTMRMITGFLTPDAGTVTIAGRSMAEDGVFCRSQFGYLPENAPVYPEMTVRAFLRFLASVRGLDGNDKRSAVARVVELCELDDVLLQPIDTLSKGYRHRTCLAQALIHDPPILVLDEPTDGLDPNQKHDVRTLIRHMGQTKVIILSTHILEEVDAVCTRSIIIDRGKIVYDGDPEDLKAKSPTAGHVRLTVKHEDSSRVRKLLRGVDGVQDILSVDSDGQWLTFDLVPNEVSDTSFTGGVAKALAAENVPVLELAPNKGRLDEVFRVMTNS